jgi:hypothetical protein
MEKKTLFFLKKFFKRKTCGGFKENSLFWEQKESLEISNLKPWIGFLFTEKLLAQ